MATRTVTGIIKKPNGAPWRGGVVRFQLVDDTYTLAPDETFPIEIVEAVADTDGEISVELASGLSAAYRVTQPDRQTFDIVVPSGSPTTLELLRSAYTGSPPDPPENLETAINEILDAWALGGPFAPVFNIRNYGGLPGQDVTAAFVAALAAKNAAGGGRIYFGPGTWLTSGLTPDTLTWMDGAGVGVTEIKLLNADGTSVIEFAANQGKIILSNMTINGNRANQTEAAHGVRLHGNTNCVLFNLEIKECFRYGIGVGYTTATQQPIKFVLFDHIEIHDIGDPVQEDFGDGIDGKRCYGCTFRHLWIHDIIDVGMDVRGQFCHLDDILIENAGMGTNADNGDAFHLRSWPYDDDYSLTLAPGPLSWNTASNIRVNVCSGNGIGLGGYFLTGREVIEGRTILKGFHVRNSGLSGVFTENQAVHLQISDGHVEGAGTYGYEFNPGRDTDMYVDGDNLYARDCALDGFYDAAGMGRRGIKLAQCRSTLNGRYGYNMQTPLASLDGCLADANVDHQVLIGERAIDVQVIGGSSLNIPSGKAGVFVDGDRATVIGHMADGLGTGVQVSALADSIQVVHNNLIRATTPLTNAGINTRVSMNPGVTDVAPTRGPLWSPDLIATNLLAWLLAEKIAQADNTAVAIWQDVTLNDNDAANAISAEQPTLQTNEINGISIVRFDGVDDDLTITGHGLSQPCTIALVAKVTGGSTSGRMFHSTNLIARRSNTTFAMDAGTAVTYGTYDVNTHVHVLTFNGASSRASFDGTATTVNPGSGVPSGNMILGSTGSASFAAMDLAEILLINGSLTADQLAKLEGYLAWKYGIQANLPGGHAYVSAAPW